VLKEVLFKQSILKGTLRKNKVTAIYSSEYRGGDSAVERYIQELLEHNDPKTTMVYTRVSSKKISEIKSPLDDLDI
jgi:integrase